MRARPTGVVVVDDLPDLDLPWLYVLTVPETVAPGGVVELHPTRRGPAAVAYSSMTNLTAACGDGQPWQRVTPKRLAQAADELAFNQVLLDVWLPEGHRYPESDPGELPDLEAAPELDATTVYLPSRPVRSGDHTVRLELQPDKKGRPLLFVYTSPEQLQAGCGPYQPWVAINAADLDLVADQAGAAGVLFNPELAEQSRHTGQIHDWTIKPVPTQDAEGS